MDRTAFVYHPAYLKHDTGSTHPESPDRLLAIEARIKKSGLYDELTLLDLPDGPRQDLEHWIEQVHHTSHLERIRQSGSGEGTHSLDPDTPVSSDSFQASRYAVEGVLTAADRILSGQIDHAFCAIRPPGHHAESNRAMGFCLFNNIAVCARFLQRRHGLKRIAIVDWDVHHGNGTQQIFYEDPTVFYFSAHQSPLYPGTGGEHEVGMGAGEGATLNCPLPSGRGDDQYVAVFEKQLVPALKSFDPEFILISAGFDAHRNDPLAGMQVTEAGFGEMTRIMKRCADQWCHGRLLSCLEGGYHLAGLARSVEEHLIALKE